MPPSRPRPWRMRRTAMKSSQTAEAARIVDSSAKDVALSVVMSSNAANTSNSAAIVTTASLGRRRLAVSRSVEISRPILVTSVKSSYHGLLGCVQVPDGEQGMDDARDAIGGA